MRRPPQAAPTARATADWTRRAPVRNPSSLSRVTRSPRTASVIDRRRAARPGCARPRPSTRSGQASRRRSVITSTRAPARQRAARGRSLRECADLSRGSDALVTALPGVPGRRYDSTRVFAEPQASKRAGLQTALLRHRDLREGDHRARSVIPLTACASGPPRSSRESVTVATSDRKHQGVTHDRATTSPEAIARRATNTPSSHHRRGLRSHFAATRAIGRNAGAWSTAQDCRVTVTPA